MAARKKLRSEATKKVKGGKTVSCTRSVGRGGQIVRNRSCPIHGAAAP